MLMVPPATPEVLNTAMEAREEFLEWFATAWRTAEDALHDGDAGPRLAMWSEREPVTLFGAWFNAFDSAEVRHVFEKLASSFSESTSSAVEVIACDVSGDLAYTAHREVRSTVVDGVSTDYVLRVTQIYRREDGVWKVVHRHGDQEMPAGMR